MEKLITQPVGIGKREASQHIQPILDEFASCIEECVNFGSHISLWDKGIGKDVDNIAPSLSFRHFLDLLDSVAILVMQGSGDTPKILLRVALETWLGIEYMLKENTKNRCMAFLVSDLILQIKSLKQMHPDTFEGKEFHKKLENPSIRSELNAAQVIDIEGIIKGKEKLLLSTEFVIAFSEYERIKIEWKKYKRKGEPSWYHYFNGPRNLEELARHLGRTGFYELLYRNWSAAVHGTDVFRNKVAIVNPEQIDIFQIRFIKDVQDVTNACLVFSNQLFKSYVQSRVPNRIKEFHDWQEKVREPFLRILNEPDRISVS